MTGGQTVGLYLSSGAAILAAIGLRCVVPALVLLLRRRLWERHPAVVTAVSTSRDWVMSRRGPDYPVPRHAYAGTVPEELQWHLAYTFVIDHQEHTGRSRQRAMPPPVVGATVHVLVHPRVRARSQFDEPETTIGRLVCGAVALVIAGRLLTDFVPMALGQ